MFEIDDFLFLRISDKEKIGMGLESLSFVSF
jgi:hypothetical protein